MSQKVLLNATEITIILNRLACQLIESHQDFSNTVLVGLQPRGIFVAKRLAALLTEEYGIKNLQLGYLDITFFRDDFRRGDKVLNANKNEMDIAVEEIKNIPLLQKIDEWWGTPYVLGGNSKNGVDCSYFTLDVMKDIFKVNLKRTAAEQYEQSFKIEWNDLKEGDLIFFKTDGSRSISHVGIYMTNNKFAHASTSQGVTISDLSEPYWQKRLYSLGRVLKN